NVILVDQLNQLRAIGKLVAWSDKPDNQFVTARVNGIAPGVDHTRTVALRDGLVIVIDRVDSADEHVYDFVYHNLGILSTGPGWQAKPVSAPLGKTANYENLIDPAQLTGSGPVRLNWDLTAQVKPAPTPVPGKKAAAPTPPPEPAPVHLALWQLPVEGSEHYTATTGMNDMNTSEIPAPAPSLITRKKAKTTSFVTVLEPFHDKPAVTGLTGTPEKFTIEREGKPLTLTANDFLSK
ncbi:MAG: hypothetical protein WCH98_22305, partial [Verrucomicrobiota bacterium]